MQNLIERFDEIAGQPRFQGWPMVDGPTDGPIIPYFGRTVDYKLATPNGIEPYTSIIRHFGWAMVFGVTTTNEVITLIQWKPGVNCASWEMPPGGIGKVPAGTTDEEILAKTQDVYLRETGYGGGDWSMVGRVMVETGKYRGAGFDDHGLPAHLYLATGLLQQAEARKPNPNEIMEMFMVPLAEFQAVIDSGRFWEVSAVACALLSLQKLKNVQPAQ